MKRMMLAVVTATALAVGGLFASSAAAQGPGGYGYRQGGYGGYGNAAPGMNIAYRTTNIAYRAPNVAYYAPNIAYSSGFAGGGYGGGYGCDCNNRYVPYGAGYVGGYQPYQQFSRPRVNFSFGY